MFRRAGFAVAFVALTVPACRRTSVSSVRAPAATLPAVSPEKGSLVIVGGGRVGREIVSRFLSLAGGPRAPIVVIPTAVGDSVYFEPGVSYRNQLQWAVSDQ